MAKLFNPGMFNPLVFNTISVASYAPSIAITLQPYIGLTLGTDDHMVMNASTLPRLLLAVTVDEHLAQTLDTQARVRITTETN